MERVAATDDALQRLLARCERWRRGAMLWRGLSRWSRLAWPSTAAVVVGIVALRLSGLPLRWGFYAVFACSLLAVPTLAQRAHELHIPQWSLPAWIDRQANARGALMERYERVDTPRPVPASVLSVPLPRLIRWRILTAWTVMACALTGVCRIPLPEPTASKVERPIAARVARTRRTVEMAARFGSAEEHAFVSSARKTLSTLAARKGGLSRADFEALEQVETRAGQALEARARTLRQQRGALDELDRIVASHAAREGDRTAAGAMAERMDRMLESLERHGAASANIRQLLKRTKAQAQAGKQQARASAATFNPASVRALRREIGELRQIVSQELATAEETGISEVPNEVLAGMAPLDLSHNTARRPGIRFEAQGFRTQDSQQTVLLATASSKRSDPRQRDKQGLSARRFSGRSDTPLWDKRAMLRHRRVLQHYFGGEHD